MHTIFNVIHGVDLQKNQRVFVVKMYHKSQITNQTQHAIFNELLNVNFEIQRIKHTSTINTEFVIFSFMYKEFHRM